MRGEPLISAQSMLGSFNKQLQKMTSLGNGVIKSRKRPASPNVVPQSFVRDGGRKIL